MKEQEIEFGCKVKMADGFPCTSLGDDPCLCDVCIKNLPSRIEALIEQEQKPMREALRISRGYITDAIAHETKPRIVWAMKVDLAKIDTALKGVGR